MKSWQVARVCEKCGAEFVASKKDVSKGWGRFCSRRCKGWSGPRRRGAAAWNWRGGRSVNRGYVSLSSGEREHVAVAERALGRPLPAGAIVHHVDHDRSNNANTNLVICHDQAYHQLLHALERVLRAGGRPFLDKICGRCKAVLPLDQFSPSKNHGRTVPAMACKPCRAADARAQRANRRTAA